MVGGGSSWWLEFSSAFDGWRWKDEGYQNSYLLLSTEHATIVHAQNIISRNWWSFWVFLSTSYSIGQDPLLQFCGKPSVPSSLTFSGKRRMLRYKKGWSLIFSLRHEWSALIRQNEERAGICRFGGLFSLFISSCSPPFPLLFVNNVFFIFILSSFFPFEWRRGTCF